MSKVVIGKRKLRIDCNGAAEFLRGIIRFAQILQRQSTRVVGGERVRLLLDNCGQFLNGTLRIVILDQRESEIVARLRCCGINRERSFKCARCAIVVSRSAKLHAKLIVKCCTRLKSKFLLES